MWKKLDFFRFIRFFNYFKKPAEELSFLKIDRAEQEKILNSVVQNLSNLNYINRSFAQYKCQMWLLKKPNKVILNIGSFIIFFPTITFLLLNGCFVLILANCESFFNRHNLKKSNFAVFFGVEKKRIPESLTKDYNKIVRIYPNFALDFKTLIFLVSKVYVKFFLHPYFCLKNTIKVSLYNANMLFIKPKAFIMTSEYSFTSSILTYYCEINNCKHINIMHGEKLFDIRDSFFKFHKCYVWHEHYCNLFKKLGADENQFVVELPRFMKIGQTNLSVPNKENQKNIFKYYLQGDETKEQLYQLLKVLDSLSENFHIIVRPHPIWSKRNELNVLSKKFEIENPDDITILDSLLTTDFICSLYSTVLFQGY